MSSELAVNCFTYSIGCDLVSSWLNISDFSKGLCGLPLPTVLNRNVTLWVAYHFCFFSTYRNRDSCSNKCSASFALFITWFPFAWWPGGFSSCYCSWSWRAFCVLTVICWWLYCSFSLSLYLCGLMEFFFISDLASLCVAVGYMAGTVLGSGRGNWGAQWD